MFIFYSGSHSMDPQIPTDSYRPNFLELKLAGASAPPRSSRPSLEHPGVQGSGKPIVVFLFIFFFVFLSPEGASKIMKIHLLILNTFEIHLNVPLNLTCCNLSLFKCSETHHSLVFQQKHRTIPNLCER